MRSPSLTLQMGGMGWKGRGGESGFTSPLRQNWDWIPGPLNLSPGLSSPGRPKVRTVVPLRLCQKQERCECFWAFPEFVSGTGRRGQ